MEAIMDPLMERSNKPRAMRSLPHFPPEIMTQILLHLPVKSLLKFRSVCKSWLSLISSSKFIKTHLHLSTISNHYSIILGTHTLPITYYTCSLSSILCNTAIHNSKALDFPIIQPDSRVLFVGTCNGLVCVSVDPVTLVFYNPSLRKSKTLPLSGTDIGTSNFVLYGFCYDELNHDFKVVELILSRCPIFMYRIEVEVYSLRNDCWRKIEYDNQGFVYGGGGISVGGILHWFSITVTGLYQIFAVNAVTCRCDTLASPKEGFVAERSLGELDECLVVFYDYYEIQLDVWAMKEYGVEESWTKLFSIAYPGDLQSNLRPLFVLKNGGLCSVAAPAYIESLVAPSLAGNGY